MKRKQKEEAAKPKPKPVPEAVIKEEKKAEAPKADLLAPIASGGGNWDPNQFREQQKNLIQAVRKPDVEEVSAFDDIHSGAMFRQAEDPYEGKSFAEVLKMKREKLERELAGKAPPKSKDDGKMNDPNPNESVEDRKKRLFAARAALLEKRKAEREKELTEYNKSKSGAPLDQARNTFYKQMIKMDGALKKNNPEQASQDG